MADYQEISKRSWRPREPINGEDVRTGALLRIAEATELIAKDYDSMRRDRDLYKRWYEDKRSEARRLGNVIRGLKSYIKRIKK